MDDISQIYKTLTRELAFRSTLKELSASLGLSCHCSLSLEHIEYVYIAKGFKYELTAVVEGERFPELDYWREFMNSLGKWLDCKSPITVSACVAFDERTSSIKVCSVREIENRTTITSEFH